MTEFPASHSPALIIVPAPTVPSVPPDVKKRRMHGLEDSILPEQFFGPRASIGALCPEAALMRAVLEDALLCLQGRYMSLGRRGQRLAQEAETWFLSEDTHWPFAFVSICEVLGLEPRAVREVILRSRSSRRGVPPKKMRSAVTSPRTLHLSA